MIDVTGMETLSLRELGGGAQCFGEFGAFGRAWTMKIIRRVRDLYKLTCTGLLLQVNLLILRILLELIPYEFLALGSSDLVTSSV